MLLPCCATLARGPNQWGCLILNLNLQTMCQNKPLMYFRSNLNWIFHYSCENWFIQAPTLILNDQARLLQASDVAVETEKGGRVGLWWEGRRWWYMSVMVLHTEKEHQSKVRKRLVICVENEEKWVWWELREIWCESSNYATVIRKYKWCDLWP